MPVNWNLIHDIVDSWLQLTAAMPCDVTVSEEHEFRSIRVVPRNPRACAVELLLYRLGGVDLRAGFFFLQEDNTYPSAEVFQELLAAITRGKVVDQVGKKGNCVLYRRGEVQLDSGRSESTYQGSFWSLLMKPDKIVETTYERY